MEEIQEALVKLGYSPNEAKVIRYLNDHNDSFQRDVERACDLRQPEVSIALSTLKRRGVVMFDTVPAVRGRSLKRYSLLRSVLNRALQDQYQKELEKKQAALQVVVKGISHGV